jgi:hypothetical protein
VIDFEVGVRSRWQAVLGHDAIVADSTPMTQPARSVRTDVGDVGRPDRAPVASAGSGIAACAIAWPAGRSARAARRERFIVPAPNRSPARMSEAQSPGDGTLPAVLRPNALHQRVTGAPEKALLAEIRALIRLAVKRASVRVRQCLSSHRHPIPDLKALSIDVTSTAHGACAC